MVSIILLSAYLTMIHDWYPAECCDQRHCHMVPCEEIHTKGDWYIWKGYTWSKQTARAAPDGACHVCHNETQTFCIFLGGTS